MSPAGSYRSFVSLTRSHTHILTQMWHSALDQISACSSQKRWGGLRGLRLNGKHRQEPFPNAPPKSQSTHSLAPPTTSARLHLRPEVRGLGSVRCGLLKLHVRRWCFSVFGCFSGGWSQRIHPAGLIWISYDEHCIECWCLKQKEQRQRKNVLLWWLILESAGTNTVNGFKNVWKSLLLASEILNGCWNLGWSSERVLNARTKSSWNQSMIICSENLKM